MNTHDRAVIEVDGLVMNYGDRAVVDNAGLHVGRGEVVALLGPNGAGKTTTVEILEGFRRRSGGMVSVLGVDPAHGDDAWRARMGIVLQAWRDHSKWRVHELLGYQSDLYRRYVPGAATATELLDAVALTEQADMPVRTLSGGQRRRLDLALGLAGRPELLFLDEPTANLDPQARRDFHDVVRDAVRDTATSVLLTTHDLWEADALATRIVILVAGRTIATGTRDDLTAQIAGRDRVSYVLDGRRHDEAVTDSTRYTRDLLAARGDDITGLEVRRASLEDTYLTYVHQAEHMARPTENAA